MGGEQLSQYVADPVSWVDVLGLQGSCRKLSDDLYRHNKNLKKLLSKNTTKLRLGKELLGFIRKPLKEEEISLRVGK
jgi:hypothetical protein